MRWTAGVITVPSRRDDLLPRTLASLRTAGFDSPRLFVDDARNEESVQWESAFGLAVTVRYPRLRVHGNWVASLYELYLREPTAERFAVFQDDFVTVRNLRAYLDKCEYPDGPTNAKTTPGYWNLYSAPSNQKLAPTENGWYKSNQLGRGAVALVFSRQAVITLLSATHLVQRVQDQHRGWRSVDGGIVESFKEAGWVEYCHKPSLVLHTGIVSAIDKRSTSRGLDETFPAYNWPDYYNSTDFPGEEFDAATLLDKSTAVG